jgi:hypothetical protein
LVAQAERVTERDDGVVLRGAVGVGERGPDSAVGIGVDRAGPSEASDTDTPASGAAGVHDPSQRARAEPVRSPRHQIRTCYRKTS